MPIQRGGEQVHQRGKQLTRPSKHLVSSANSLAAPSEAHREDSLRKSDFICVIEAVNGDVSREVVGFAMLSYCS